LGEILGQRARGARRIADHASVTELAVELRASGLEIRHDRIEFRRLCLRTRGGVSDLVAVWSTFCGFGALQRFHASLYVGCSVTAGSSSPYCTL
jgi:hypothetical protein